MALSLYTAGELRRRALLTYGEEGGGGEFATATMNTFVNRAIVRFAIDSGIVIGSTRTARPVKTSTAPGEALVTLARGYFDPKRIVHERREYAGAAYYTDVRPATQRYLAILYGPEWAYALGSEAGAGPTAEHWYRKRERIIGIFPGNLGGHTAGTLVIWSSWVPNVLTNDTAPCQIPPEYIEGVIMDTCRQMAERDADSDAEGARAARFEAQTKAWIERAKDVVGGMWDVVGIED